MPRSPLDRLTDQVTRYFRAQATQYGLRDAHLQVRYILNWGGFVNASFHVSDGQTAYHLKLADDEDAQESLARWKHFAEPLSERYHAPRVLAWLKIPRSPFAGLLLEHIPGQAADLSAQPELLRGVLDLLARLHADRALAAALEELDGPPLTCGDYFISVYIDRFDEDLLGVVRDLPPFVSLPLLDWMQGETRELEGLARDLPAFQRPADSPTHGDLWASNILVRPDGGWSIIDWDDLALGDPALDYNILLGPLLQSGALPEARLEDLLAPGPASDLPDFRSRFQVCRRAYLLDQVIDSLADWVEAGFAPEHQQEVRAAKEQHHRQALERYRQIYGE